MAEKKGKSLDGKAIARRRNSHNALKRWLRLTLRNTHKRRRCFQYRRWLRWAQEATTKEIEEWVITAREKWLGRKVARG